MRQLKRQKYQTSLPATCLLRNLYADQEATVRTGHGKTDWFKIGKGIRQGLFKSTLLFKKQRRYFAYKSLYSQNYGFSSSRVRMWELDIKKGWVLENWCFWTVVLEKTLESPWDCKEIKPVNPKGNQPWILFGRTDAEAEGPILWSPDKKSWLIGKGPDAGKDWRQESKGMIEDEMVGWHHRLSGHEFEQTLGDSEGQGGLACCNPWGRKESDTTEWLNWTEKDRK